MAQDNEFIASLFSSESQRQALGSSIVHIANLYLYNPAEFNKQHQMFLARLGKRGIAPDATQDVKYQQELYQLARDSQDFLNHQSKEFQTLAQTREGPVARGLEKETQQHSEYSKKNEAFLHALVKNISTRLPEEQAKAVEAKENTIVRRLQEAGNISKDKETLVLTTSAVLRQELPPTLLPDIGTITQTIVTSKETRNLLSSRWGAEDATFSRTGNPHNYSLLEQAVLQANPNLSRHDAKRLSEQYVRVVDALTTRAPNEEENQNAAHQFFRFIASDGTRGVGTFFDNMGSFTDTLKRASVASALKKLEKEIPHMQERLGNEISQQLYKQVAGQMGEAIFHDSPRHLSSPIIDFFGDAINTVVGGGPLDDMRLVADLGALDKHMGTHFVNIDELTTTKLALVHAYRTETMTTETLFHFLVVWGADGAAQNLTSSAKQGILSSGINFAAREAAASGIGKVASSIVGAGGKAAAGGALGGAWGIAGAALLDRLLRVKDRLLGLVGFSGQSKGKQLIAAILTTILAVVFVGGLGIHLEDVTRSAPIALGGGSSEEAPPLCDPRTDPTCALPFCDSTKQDCRWPTQRGCITQGPYDGEGNTHKNLNAIDVGTLGGSRITVFATHDGTVSFVEASYINDIFVSGKYGNQITIDGVKDGRPFQTLYTHLSHGSILVHKDSVVKMGDPIAQTDNNGQSSGEHLHYEYRGGGDISEILPVPVPHCAYGSCPSICWGQ